MNQTLAQAIAHEAVDFSDLDRQHRPMLRLVKELIGVIPNCDPFLEIWPTGFRTYNLLVPNLLNLPGSLFGAGTAKDLVGLAMYTASRAAECMYCSAHTCSFALRRGTSPEALTGDYTDIEAAVAAVAEGMSTVPATLSADHVDELRLHLDDADIEWLALSAALMGFLNKFMDTMGIELEQSAIDDVSDLITDTGWSAGKHAWSTEDLDPLFDQLEGRTLSSAHGRSGSLPSNPSGDGAGHKNVQQDSLGTYLRVLRQTPGALRRDRAWTRGMSARTGESLLSLEEHIGFASSTMSAIAHGRAARAIATVIRDNMNAETTTIGLDVKCLISLVYARAVGNDVLTAEAVQMAQRVAPSLGHRKLTAVGRFATADLVTASLPPGLTKTEAAAVMLAKAAAPSPSEVNEITVAMATDLLTPVQLVEAVTWLSVQQLLHRMQVFTAAANGSIDDDVEDVIVEPKRSAPIEREAIDVPTKLSESLAG
jgi:alkylhydroperoxidase family enzyme